MLGDDTVPGSPRAPNANIVQDTEPRPAAGFGSARLIAVGIFLSRISGLIRDIIFANYFGTSSFASAFRGALRMPNVLQNLLGEGTLSASFIPVYSKLLERGEHAAAGRLAGATFALLLAVAGALALFGVVMAPVLVSVLLIGLDGEIREITIQCTRIMFPMAGVLVLSAWALGVLNSHRKFFISYTAPVVWNATMIAVLLLLGTRLDQHSLVVALAWGALIGGALQFLVQVPWIVRLQRGLRPHWDVRSSGPLTVIRNAGPAILGRGVVQLSGWLDMFLASFLFTGAIAAIAYAQTFYMLPVSLFGMSIAAAELPELARKGGSDAAELRVRVSAGLRQMAVFVVPSAIGYLVLGDIIMSAMYERGDFDRADTLLVWFILAGYSVGLLASTSSRLYASAFYALEDTGTPARIALIRVVASAILGVTFMLLLEPVKFRGITIDWGQSVTVLGNPVGAAGLAAGTGLAAWLEWILLRRALGRRVGDASAEGVLLKLIAAAAIAGAAARCLLWFLPPLHRYPALFAALVTFGAIYVTVARWLGVEEVRAALSRFRRRVGIR